DGSTEVTVSILGNGETIHKLDNKYLDLDWLPVITHAKGEIVAERTGSANYFGTAWFGQATPYNVTPGKYYFVVWNGDEYRVQFEPGTDEHVYGSFSSDAFAITYAYDSSEVPSLRYGFRCRPLDGSTEVALSIYESVAVPNKIPDEFLPDGYASGGTVELDTTLTQEGKAADAKAVGDAISKLSGGNANYGAENAGKLLYVGADGFATVLALGAGLAIENGVLILTGNSQGILVNDDGEGNVTVSNLAVTDDGNGNVTVTGVTVTDDGNGNVSVA
ncbi:MAG: hypothetical protein IIU86_02495, partial [Oscillospiraceae bacterium]|nr:hypothetical protein [Oscillospiraceae bacterium]